MLRADDVHKRYDELEVLRGVTFEVEPGQVKVIIGPSGSGKSTLLRCLALLEEPDAGEVSLEGQRPGPGEVGMVFQRFNLFQNMTALAERHVRARRGAAALEARRARAGDGVPRARRARGQGGAVSRTSSRAASSSASRSRARS